MVLLVLRMVPTVGDPPTCCSIDTGIFDSTDGLRPVMVNVGEAGDRDARQVARPATAHLLAAGRRGLQVHFQRAGHGIETGGENDDIEWHCWSLARMPFR